MNWWITVNLRFERLVQVQAPSVNQQPPLHQPMPLLLEKHRLVHYHWQFKEKEKILLTMVLDSNFAWALLVFAEAVQEPRSPSGLNKQLVTGAEIGIKLSDNKCSFRNIKEGTCLKPVTASNSFSSAFHTLPIAPNNWEINSPSSVVAFSPKVMTIWRHLIRTHT